MHAGDLEPTTRAGKQFPIHAAGSVGGEVVWESRNVYLKRGGGSGGSSSKVGERSGPAPARAHWRVPGGHRPPLRAPCPATATRSTCTR